MGERCGCEGRTRIITEAMQCATGLGGWDRNENSDKDILSWELPCVRMESFQKCKLPQCSV